MNGQPVWLASISRMRRDGSTLYIPEWSAPQMRDAERLVRGLVGGIGNPARERLFRMNVTLCLHRAATVEEVAAQPPWFLTAQGGGLAGGPVAVLSETEPGSASTRPCEVPGRRTLDRRNPHSWIAIDCGQCEPCRARKRCLVDML